jgi:hypothetical protein
MAGSQLLRREDSVPPHRVSNVGAKSPRRADLWLECQCSDCEMYERIAVNLPGVCNHYKCYCEDSYCTVPWSPRHPPHENMAELEYRVVPETEYRPFSITIYLACQSCGLATRQHLDPAVPRCQCEFDHHLNGFQRQPLQSW